MLIPELEVLNLAVFISAASLHEVPFHVSKWFDHAVPVYPPARIESVDGVQFTLDPDYRSGTFVVQVKVTAAGVGQIEETISPFE